MGRREVKHTMMPPGSENGRTLGRRIRSFVLTQEGSLLVFLLLVMFVLSRLSREFATVDNLLAISRLFVEVGLMAIPMTMIIITGGTDLSVGSLFGWTSVMLGAAWEYWHLPLPVAVLACLLFGVLGGAFNGLIITWLRIPPLIVTLSTMAVFRGLAYGVSQARSVRGWPESFWVWGQGYLGPLPTQLVVWLAIVLAAGILLGRTKAGRYIYALGNNELGARYSGIAVDRIKFWLYTFSGLTAAIAGIIFVSRVTTTRADAGTGIELDVITAVLLGGTSITGGRGSILGTVLGLLTVSFLKNGLSLSGVKGDATVVIIGAVLVLSVFLNRAFARPMRA